MKKDKIRAENVELDNSALRVFLDQKSYDETPADYVVLEKAYRSLSPDLFGEFIEIFKSEGRDMDAKNLEGQSIAQVIAGHPASAEYLGKL